MNNGKINNLEELNEFLRERMREHNVDTMEFNVWENDDKKLLVDVDSMRLTVEFIVFLGNCLKKYKDGVLYTDATL